MVGHTPQVVSPGGVVGEGQIFDSNRTALLAAVKEVGATPTDLGISKDE